MEQSPIDSAVILATGRIFNRPGEPAPSGPLTSVGGLSLFQRTLFTLQRGGISRLVVLAEEETNTLKKQIRGDARVTAEVRWLPVREFSPDDPRTWESIAGMFGGPYLVAAAGAVFAASLVARVRDEGGKHEPLVVVHDEAMLEAGKPEAVREAFGGRTEGEGVVMVETSVEAIPAVDLVAVPESFTSPGWAGAQEGHCPLQAALERGIRQGQVRLLPLQPDWYQEVSVEGPANQAAAERTLLRSLTGGLEGFVDRHINRRCSKWITRMLLRTTLTPNAVTVLATAVGLLAATSFALGGYAAGIAGALLLQLSSILHCCHGEVARLKFMEAAFGEQWDVSLDNVVHIGLFAGMGWAAYRSGWGAFALAQAGLAILGNAAAFAVVRRAFKVRDVLDTHRRRRVETMLNRFVSRDFSILILALALLGHVEWFLLLAAIGLNVFWPLLAWQLKPAKLYISPR